MKPTKETDAKLKPCPFCGRKAKMIQPIAGKNRAWNAYCTGGDYGVDSQCGVVIFGRDGQPKGHVAELWNTRATSAIERQRDDLTEKLRTQATEHSLANRRLEDEIGRLKEAITIAREEGRSAGRDAILSQFSAELGGWNASPPTHPGRLVSHWAFSGEDVYNDDEKLAKFLLKTHKEQVLEALSPSPPAVEVALNSDSFKCPKCAWIGSRDQLKSVRGVGHCPQCWLMRAEAIIPIKHPPVQTEEKPATVPQSFNEWFNTKVPQEMRDAYLRSRMQMAWDAARAGTVQTSTKSESL